MLFQSWFGDDLWIVFLMCGLANARMLLQKWAGSERLSLDGFGGMSTRSRQGSEPIPAFAR